MVLIVGIDFGTTNVRVSYLDPDSGRGSSSSLIGRDGVSVIMPAVIAFRRLPGGNVTIEVGEDADELVDDNNTLVIRNIKRWAVGSDHYVSEHLERSLEENGDSWPTWWDPVNRNVRLWNTTMKIEDVIQLILEKAVKRADLERAVAEWRAGCPVNSDLTYRKALISALSALGCTGRVEWTSEEPLLLLAFGMEANYLSNGSYLVYDIGGGSFDCAIAEISDGYMTVLSEEGIPTLGGVNIDEALTKELRYEGRPNALRVAKEQLSSDPGESIQLLGGYTLTNELITSVLEDEGFIDRTLEAALAAYRRAKLTWKRERHKGSPPMGTELDASSISGAHRSVWSLDYDDMVQDIDCVLLVGGPTQMPFFRDQLGQRLGEGTKIVTADDMVREAGRLDITQAALTVLSHGACYTFDQHHSPVTLDRIPASITLTVTDGESTSEDIYEAFHKLPFENPMADHVGPWTSLNSKGEKTYSVLIETADGEYVAHWGPSDMRMPRNGYRGPRSSGVRLALDRLGRVFVEVSAISEGMNLEEIANRSDVRIPFRLPRNPPVRILRDPFWQTELQKEKIRALYAEQEKYEAEKRAILHRNITDNPFGYGERSG